MPVAIITGAGRGIGRHLATVLADDGWTTVVTGRTAAQVEDTAAAITAAGGTSVAVIGDVTDASHIAEVVTTAEGLGDLELLVNNAGAEGSAAMFVDADVDAWWRVIETNLRGPMLATREVLPIMRANGGGRIIAINSLGGAHAFPHFSAYSVSKSALMRFTDCLAAEEPDSGVHFFDVSPGLVHTDMAHAVAPVAFPDATEEFWTPIEKVAEVVLALASGRYDALSGRFVHAEDDLDDLLARVTRLGVGRQLRLSRAGEDDPLFAD